jgi:Tfp pilus assembly protein PilW
MRKLCAAAVRLLEGQAGVTLVELLVVTSMMVLVVWASLTLLVTSSRDQHRDQAYAEEISSTTAALARLAHDLRQATKIVSASPNSIEFLMPVSGSTAVYDIKYTCTASDTRGAGYTRCARVRSVYPAPLPAVPATAASADIVHVSNGSIATYCTSNGSGPSGSVFFYQNAVTPDTTPGATACDESYVDRISLNPTYIGLRVVVPAAGDVVRQAALTHSTVLQDGAYMRNLDVP